MTVLSAETRQIVARCLAGHSSAIGELVERYRDQVFALCLNRLGQRQDAEDAQQETFVRVFRSLACWNPARDFEPWLMAIAANRCRTMLAKRSRRPTLSALVDVHEAHGCPVGTGVALREELSGALSQLRPHYRMAFLMFHREHLAYDEIGRRLQRPVGTVKTWVHRARLELMQHLVRRGVDANLNR